MSSYQIKPINSFSQRTDWHAPLTRSEYEALNSIRRPVAAQDQTPAKVDISSAAGRESNLAALKQKYNVQPLAASLIGSLNPSGFSFGTGLYSGVGQLSEGSMKSLINNYV